MAIDTQRWRYKVMTARGYVDFWGRLKPDVMQQVLDELGRDGWELVSTIQPYGVRAATLFFKRPA